MLLFLATRLKLSVHTRGTRELSFHNMRSWTTLSVFHGDVVRWKCLENIKFNVVNCAVNNCRKFVMKGNKRLTLITLTFLFFFAEHDKSCLLMFSSKLCSFSTNWSQRVWSSACSSFICQLGLSLRTADHREVQYAQHWTRDWVKEQKQRVNQKIKENTF